MTLEGKVLDRRVYEKGRTIFKEGGDGDAAYVVNEGIVGIWKTINGQRVPLATLNKGAIFGEMALIDGSKRMANAQALTAATCVRIPADEFHKRMKAADPFIRAMLTIFTDNLRTIQTTHMRRPRGAEDMGEAIKALIRVLTEQGTGIANADIVSDIGETVEEMHTLRKDIEALADRLKAAKAQAIDDIDAA